jgi:prolactin regulatory element-binding protein
VTEEEKAGKGKGKETEKEKEKTEGEQGVEDAEGDELGRWDVLVRREVAGKPVTVFDVR